MSRFCLDSDRGSTANGQFAGFLARPELLESQEARKLK